MKSPEEMTREQLVARLRVVEAYLSAARELSLLSPEQNASSPIEQDFLVHRALRLLDRGGTAAFIYEIQGNLGLLDANGAFASLVGCSGSDLWSLSVLDLFPAELRPKLQRLLAKPRPQGFVETGIWRGIARQGDVRRVFASGHDLIFQGRKARFVLLHPAQEKGDPNALLGQLIAAIPSAIFLRSAQGTIRSWNASAEQLLGYTAKEIVGRDEQVLYAPEEFASIKTSIEASLSQGERLERSAKLRHRDGTTQSLQVSATSLSKDLGHMSVWVLRMAQPAQAPHSEPKPATAHEWRWEQDSHLAFTYYSEEAERGPDPQLGSVLGKGLFDLPIRWISVADKRHYERLLGARQPFQGLEIRIPEVGGRERSVILSGGPIFDERGNFLGYRGVGRDVTQRSRQDAQIQLLSTLLAATEDAVFTLSTDLTVVSWNPGAERLLGYQASEIMGKRFIKLTSALLDEFTSRGNVAKSFFGRDIIVRRKGGSNVSVSIHCSPMRNTGGDVLGWAVILRDTRPGKALAERITRLSQALRSAHLYLWDWESASGQVSYDEEFTRMLGYGQNELPADAGPFAGLVESSDAPNVFKTLRSLQHGKTESCEMEFRIWKKTGELLWIGVRGTATGKDEDGRVQHVLGTCLDITARKRHDQAQAVFSAVLDSEGDAVFSHSIDGVMLAWNPSAQRMLGYNAAEILGQSHDVLIPDTLKGQYEEIVQRLSKGEPGAKLRTTRRHKNGLAVQTALSVAPIRDASGLINAIAVVGRDISAEYEAGLLAGRLARIVESSQDAIISFDGNANIASFNRGAQRMLGYAETEMVGQNADRIFSQRLVEVVWAVSRQPGTGQSITQFETQQTRKDGVVLDVSASFFPLLEGHNVAGVGCITRDISDRIKTERALKHNEARFRSLVEATHQAAWITNAHGEMLIDNPSWQSYTGLSFEESKGTGWLVAVHPDDREHAMLRWASALAGGSIYECPQRVRRADGQWRRMIARAVPVRAEDGSIAEWIGIHTDITEQRNTEDALRESEARLQSILNSAAEGIVVIDGTGSIERLNIAAQRMFGYTPEDYWDLDLKHLIIELDREFEGEASEERYAAWLRRMIGSQRDLTGRRKDGRLFPLELSVNEVPDGGHETRFVGIVRDVTERKSWEARIFQLAYSDALTGLPNRLLLVDRLEQAVAAAQRNKSLVGVLFFDFDGFKRVNDHYGHHTGDLLLKGMSERLRNCVREIDTVSRLGGDEFVVVLPELKEGADAGAVARKITATLSQAYRIENRDITVTLSAGISIYPDDAESAEILIRNADTAMYFAKESGKNQFRFFNPGLQSLN